MKLKKTKEVRKKTKKSKGISSIHPTAIIHPKAQIGAGVRVGPFSIIGQNVKIGAGSHIASHAVVEGWTTLGEGVEVGIGAVLGAAPQDYSYKGEQSLLEIGNWCVFREYCTVHRGTVKGGGVTRVGDECYVMAYAHIAHDCQIGRGVLLANAVTMAGHVTIEDYAIVSGLVTIHQHVHVGAHSIIGGSSRIPKDIVPYAMVAGNPVKVYGPNLEGLVRHCFPDSVVAALKKCFKILFSSGLNVSQGLQRIEKEVPPLMEVKTLLDFIKNSPRGISR